MLTDTSLPPHIISGLRAVAALLATPNVATRAKPTGQISISLADFNDSEDSEENPYTGERPSVLPKVLTYIFIIKFHKSIFVKTLLILNKS